MRTMARVGMLSILCSGAAAMAADTYVIREDVPETGSNIAKPAVTWPIPVNKRYEELTGDELRIVRDDYVSLGARDEPPYPRDGMTPILAEVARIQKRGMGTGLLHLAVRVDARGEPQGVAILKSPDPAVAHAVAYSLMNTRYRPARCDGAPCASDFSFKYRLENAYGRNFIVDWNPVLWMAPLKRD